MHSLPSTLRSTYIVRTHPIYVECYLVGQTTQLYEDSKIVERKLK